MTRLYSRLVISLLLLEFIPLVASSSSILPVGQPEYDFLYGRWHRQEALTYDRFDYQLGPFSDSKQQFSFGPLEYVRQITESDIQLFVFAAEDFQSSRLTHPAGYESYRAGFAAHSSDKIFAYGNFSLDQRKAKDPFYSGKKWRGLAGGVEQAFVAYQTKTIDLMFGRFASFWGPRESLVLAATNNLDGFAYTVRWGHLVISYRLARLDGQNSLTDSGAVFENRYFAGHRLDLHLADNLRIGLFETVIFAGAGRTLELNYLNPLLFFHAEQLNDNINDNTLLGLDASYSPAKRLRLFGQLLIDDFQIEKKSQGDQEPNEYGLLVGGEVIDVMPRVDVQLEYTRVTNRTFNQPLPRNRYEYQHSLLGAAEGNDYDLLRAEVTRWFGEYMRGLMTLSYHRQGEGSVYEPWSSPWLDIQGSYREPFPTGVVEKTLSVGLGIAGFIGNHVFVQGMTGLMHHANFDHVENDNRTSAYLNIRLSTFFNFPMSID